MSSYSRVDVNDTSKNPPFPDPISFSTPQQARQRQTHISDEEKGLIEHEYQENHGQQKYPHVSQMVDNRGGPETFWERFSRKGKRKVGVIKSLRNLALSSWINILLLLIPVSWLAHFRQEEAEWGHVTVFILALLAIIPLEHLFEYGGDQMRCYLGKDLGDLVVITLNNAVEATLGVMLLLKCELVLLKSTIIEITGVIILHLLLVPGTAFILGGARIIQQDLHPHLTQLNQSTLTVGVLTLLLPFAIFTALNSSFNPRGGEVVSAVNDEVRGKILELSRGLAILLLIVYVCSRIYLHNPPGEDNAMALHLAPNAPEALKHEAELFKKREPELNQWVCIIMLLVALGLMATTAEWLVESIEPVREEGNISEIWFGLILLPLVSFAADGLLASVYFVRHMLRHFFKEPIAPTTLAQAESIDLSIQFALFWMPLYVLIGWFSGRPLTLLFDIFEVALVIGSCFLVNYVTADSKTNWAEGVAMVIFYVMIALAAWFYDGQPETMVMSTCESVASVIAALASGGGEGDLTSTAHH
ncbi:hypothetical protein CPB83DRAFT_304938 [Crepidotus variabilis]|uniref:Sodium/calcium exchanger membrane region domain-containing protein n=1 Tax=Crepidotus variabilis TaxID=179855 RepID=A0A9P6EGQ0_9AGAR|nr:hypothetical protein CPB83DRAFT_304938 [Crepidotus variabilis]